MSREQALQVLNSKSSSKAQLREALAGVLGVDWVEQERVTVSLFSVCRDFFLAQYGRDTGLSYAFKAKDGLALRGILDRIGSLFPEGHTEKQVEEGFKALIIRLPEWYKHHAYNLPVINNKFNDIVLQIKNHGKSESVNHKQERIKRSQGVSALARRAKDILASAT